MRFVIVFKSRNRVVYDDIVINYKDEVNSIILAVLQGSGRAVMRCKDGLYSSFALGGTC